MAEIIYFWRLFLKVGVATFYHVRTITDQAPVLPNPKSATTP
jgi:hypothetical protein